jgi:hypothetical protein
MARISRSDDRREHITSLARENCCFTRNLCETRRFGFLRAVVGVAPFQCFSPGGNKNHPPDESLPWVAPANAVVDGASIPKFAWSIIGEPFEGQYVK